MVIGSGLIATGFAAYKENAACLIFASGVSNSSNKDFAAFDREKVLLQHMLAEHTDKTFVYFSTCSVYDQTLQNSSYVQHKLAMEAIVMKGHTDFHIFRISNLAGKTNNPHTVLNFFIQHILNGQSFNLWRNASRNIIDIQDAFAICDYVIQQKILKNQLVNVANPVNYTVPEIVHTIEMTLGKKGNYTLLDKESNLRIELQPITEIIKLLGLTFDDQYLEKTIKKYLP